VWIQSETLNGVGSASIATLIRRVYEDSKNQVTDRKARVLHPLSIEEILKWTKAHLDAYLATAEVILEQNVEPG